MSDFTRKITFFNNITAKFIRNGNVWRWYICSFQSKAFKSYKEAMMSAKEFAHRVRPLSENPLKCLQIPKCAEC